MRMHMHELTIIYKYFTCMYNGLQAMLVTFLIS